MGYYVLSTPDGSKWDIPDTMREEEAFRRLKESNPEAFSTAVDEVETKTDTEKLVDLYNSRFTYQQTRYIHLTLNTLKKYYYLHHYIF